MNAGHIQVHIRRLIIDGTLASDGGSRERIEQSIATELASRLSTRAAGHPRAEELHARGSYVRSIAQTIATRLSGTGPD